jgi:hypothetical protein
MLCGMSSTFVVLYMPMKLSAEFYFFPFTGEVVIHQYITNIS